MFKRSRYDAEILALAVPAFGALVAEPLYILADTAVVGHLGTPQLGGLALASQLLLIIHAVFIFLAYGTTAAVGRLIGAGAHQRAAHQAIQSLWLAAMVGVVMTVLVLLSGERLLAILGGEGSKLDFGATYLQISAFGIPAMLIGLAGVGYLRGQQDTVGPLVVAVGAAIGNLVLELVLIYGFNFGIGASALATVLMQWLSAAVFVGWILRSAKPLGVSLAPDLAAFGGLARDGVYLFFRTAALRGSFVVAIAVAARIGDDDLAAHQIAFEVWSLFALGLDSLAIAAQAMIANRLGANKATDALEAAKRILFLGLGFGFVTGAIVVASIPIAPGWFSNDAAVVSLTGFLFLFVAAQQPLNSVVFTLDGLLIGAGDLRFLAVGMVSAAAIFVGLAWLVWATDSGIGWLWAAITVFMAVRAIPLLVRFRSQGWLITGAYR